jgi:hypothetical protein
LSIIVQTLKAIAVAPGPSQCRGEGQDQQAKGANDHQQFQKSESRAGAIKRII